MLSSVYVLDMPGTTVAFDSHEEFQLFLTAAVCFFIVVKSVIEIGGHKLAEF